MSCYRVLKSEGLIQPKRVGQDLRQAAEQRRQRLKAAEKINKVLQVDFTTTGDGRRGEVPHRWGDRISESVNLVSEGLVPRRHWI